MASASEGQVEFSADPTNLSSFMKLHEATRSFALPVGSHGVPLDPHEGAPTAPSPPQRARNVRLAAGSAAVVHGRDVCTPCWDSMNEERASPADVPYAFPGTGWLRAAVDKCAIKRLYALKHSARVHWTHPGAVGA
jgi:hypothetical protein